MPKDRLLREIVVVLALKLLALGLLWWLFVEGRLLPTPAQRLERQLLGAAAAGPSPQGAHRDDL